jgi:hypothetical protein
MVFSQDEIREALGYGTIVDESQVLVPTNHMPLSDMRSMDLATEQVDTQDTEDEDEDIDQEL